MDLVLLTPEHAARLGARDQRHRREGRQDAEVLATELVGGERFSRISPTDRSNDNRSGARMPPDLRLLLVEVRGFEP